VGFALVSPPVAAGVAGFLPLNLNARERAAGRDPAATPTAYLGDSGSHVLGFLVLVSPFAWPVLLVPLLDIARLSVVRVRAGSRPWIGDRRHLAHRLAAVGLSRVAAAAVLGGIALPACLAVGVARLADASLAVPALLGATGTILLFLVALAATRRAAGEGEIDENRETSGP